MATRDTLQIIAGGDLKMDIHRNDLLNQDKEMNGGRCSKISNKRE